MPITALPTPPSRQDPANFPARGDALLGALPVFVADANALAADVTTKAASAVSSASTAATAATTATAKEALATSAAATAVEKAAIAVAAAESAQTSGSAVALIADLASSASGKGSELVGYLPAGTGSVATDVQTKLRELMSVTDKGAVSLTTINAAIADTSDGTLTIPPGTYAITGDILIQSKNSGSSTSGEGFFTLDATGVRFSGSGKIIIDSCKRVKIIGLDAPNHDLHWRGCWWSEFDQMRFRKLVIGDAAGTGFSSTYWNRINGGQSQAVVFDAVATSPCNAIEWNGHTLRGDAGQGFSGTANYAFEFNSNQNAQNWKFNGGDVSYHNSAVYNIDAANTSGDVELIFDGTYFDTHVPQPFSRDSTRINSIKAHHANGTCYFATLAQATAGAVDMYRDDRQWKTNAAQGINLIPNGDFRQTLTTWVGSGLPVGNLNSATLTVSAGGLSGVYLNISQALTTSNSIRFRPSALPHAGRATATIVLRNADAGTKNLVISFGGLSPPVALRDAEFSVFRITTGGALASGSVNDIIISTNDDTAFNVDVAYVGVTMGEGAELIVPSNGFRTIEYSQSHDFPSVAAGGQAFTDFTVPGAVLGDFVLVSSSSGMLGLSLTANINAANTVRLLVQNNTASPIDLGLAAYYVRIWKRGYV